MAVQSSIWLYNLGISQFMKHLLSCACNIDAMPLFDKQYGTKRRLFHVLKVTRLVSSTVARSMISSDAWNINLSSNEGYAVVDTLKSPTFSWEDPSMAEDDYDDYGGGDDDHQSVTWR